jgi:hypothetical protein
MHQQQRTLCSRRQMHSLKIDHGGPGENQAVIGKRMAITEPVTVYRWPGPLWALFLCPGGGRDKQQLEQEDRDGVLPNHSPTNREPNQPPTGNTNHVKPWLTSRVLTIARGLEPR